MSTKNLGLIVAGIATLGAVWLFTRQSGSRTVQPVVSTTGTALTPPLLFDGLRGISRANEIQQSPDRTGAYITAGGQILQSVPDLVSNIKGLFTKRKSVGASLPAASSLPTFDTSIFVPGVSLDGVSSSFATPATLGSVGIGYDL